jgi:hypothetical protein
MKRLWLFIITLLLITPLLMAVGLRQEISPATMAAIGTVIAVLVGIVGPRPVGTLIGWAEALLNAVFNRFPPIAIKGQGAVLFVYALSFGVGVIGLLVSKQLLGFEFVWENVLAIGGVLFAAATFAFHRLKSLGEIQ